MRDRREKTKTEFISPWKSSRYFDTIKCEDDVLKRSLSDLLKLSVSEMFIRDEMLSFTRQTVSLLDLSPNQFFDVLHILHRKYMERRPPV